jgi:hypothetical protein
MKKIDLVREVVKELSMHLRTEISDCTFRIAAQKNMLVIHLTNSDKPVLADDKWPGSRTIFIGSPEKQLNQKGQDIHEYLLEILDERMKELNFRLALYVGVPA